MNRIPPRQFKSNANIAIIAPASSPNTAEVKKGMEILSKMGFNPIMGDNVSFLKSKGLYSASLKDRLAEFIWAVEDDDIDIIMCTCGGFGSGQLLPFLPYETIAEKRKLIIGFSDTNALNNGIFAKCGLCSFNGPTASIRIDTTQYTEEDSKALKHMFDVLGTSDFWGDIPFLNNKMFPRCVCNGKAQGIAIGGNLSTICTLVGTPYMPDLENTILFIEDTGENNQELSRLLLHLKLSNVLNSVNGIVVGTFVNNSADPAQRSSIERTLVEFLSNGPPCIYGLNFSHVSPTAVIPIGTMAYIDTSNLQVMFDNPYAQ